MPAATAAKPARSLFFDAMTRMLRLTVGKCVEVYGVHDVPAPMEGVTRWRLVKVSDGSRYSVTRSESGNFWCDCPAGYHGKPCKHTGSVARLVQLGKL